MRKEISTNFENENTLNQFCNASKTLALITGRWKLSILFSLFEDHSKTFSDFKTLLTTVSDRVLALQLKNLLSDGLIAKDNTAYIPTAKGRSLHKILADLAAWNE